VLHLIVGVSRLLPLPHLAVPHITRIMASSATFIQVSENDPALDLVTLVVDLTFAAEEQKADKVCVCVCV